MDSKGRCFFVAHMVLRFHELSRQLIQVNATWIQRFGKKTWVLGIWTNHIIWSSPEIYLVYRLPPRMPVTNMVVKGHRTCKDKGRNMWHICVNHDVFFVRIHCHSPSSLSWPGPSCKPPVLHELIEFLHDQLRGKNILSWIMNVALPTDFPQQRNAMGSLLKTTIFAKSTSKWKLPFQLGISTWASFSSFF